MPKYPATIATPPTAHQAANRTRGGRRRGGAGTGGDAVGVGEVEVGGVWGAAVVVGLPLVVGSLLARRLLPLGPGCRSLIGVGRRDPGPSLGPVFPVAGTTGRGRGDTHRVLKANQGDEVIVNRVEVVLLRTGQRT